MSSLRYALAIPSSGGKIILCSSYSFFVDIDIFYNLRPIPALWNHMNHEIQRRRDCHQRIPLATAAELRSRIEKYVGPGRCLLTHSITVAEKSGLQVLGVLVPEKNLHQRAMVASGRDEIACWFAQQNAQVLIQQATTNGHRIRRYTNFEEFEDAIVSLFPSILKHERTPIDIIEFWDTQSSTNFEDLRWEEELLLQLCTTAVGCAFEEGNIGACDLSGL